MAVLNFVVGTMIFAAGMGIAVVMDFDWKAFWDYRLKRDEMAMKYMKGGDTQCKQ